MCNILVVLYEMYMLMYVYNDIFSFSDLGAHIDGFIAVVAHTVAVGGGEVTGRAADVLLAAHLASEAALRLLRPGNEVTNCVIYLFYNYTLYSEIDLIIFYLFLELCSNRCCPENKR